MDKGLEQTLALAGIAQCSFLVHQLAHHGLVAHDKFSTAINSLFITNPKTTEEVYGSKDKLNLGFQVLHELIQGGSDVFSAPEVMRYTLGLLHLEGKLHNNQRMLDEISKGLDSISSTYPVNEIPENDLAIKELSRLYQRTLSTFSFRVQVLGDMNYLKNELTAEKVRACLLCGIRSAVLWRQLGGRRWHLMFYRKQIGKNVNRLMNKLY